MKFDSGYMIDIDDGRLISSRDSLSRAFLAAKESGKPIVLHFHGGLVQRDTAIKNSIATKSFYDTYGAFSIFPIWRTGILETLGDVWVEIAKESLFQILIDRVSGWAHGQILNVVGCDRAGIPERTLATVTVPTMIESGNNGDFSKEFLQGVDVKELKGKDLKLFEIEEEAIKAELTKDTNLKLEIDAILAGAGKPVDPDTRDLDGINPQKPKESIADRAVLEQLAEDANARSLGLGTALKVLDIVKEVLKRFMEGRDHGLHATVVEEVLRAFYLGSIGTTVWEDMKNDAAAAFNGGDEWAGTAILDEIARVPKEQRIMLLGHSAGAIFISEMMKKAGAGPRPFEIVFIAPAVRTKVFVDGVVKNQAAVSHFRMYSMSDENEKKDFLIRGLPVVGDLPWFYPRSLLYLISGILEQDAVDADVLGLQRFNQPNCWNAGNQFVKAAKEFCAAGTDRICWSVTSGDNNKLQTNSLSHGGFATPGDDNLTMVSIGHVLKTGW